MVSLYDKENLQIF